MANSTKPNKLIREYSIFLFATGGLIGAIYYNEWLAVLWVFIVIVLSLDNIGKERTNRRLRETLNRTTDLLWTSERKNDSKKLEFFETDAVKNNKVDVPVGNILNLRKPNNGQIVNKKGKRNTGRNRLNRRNRLG